MGCIPIILFSKSSRVTTTRFGTPCTIFRVVYGAASYVSQLLQANTFSQTKRILLAMVSSTCTIIIIGIELILILLVRQELLCTTAYWAVPVASITGHANTIFLRDVLIELLEDVPLETRR